MGRRGHQDNGKAESMLREQFRVGARNAVSRRIWNSIQCVFYPELSQAGIAERLQMARSNITRWKRGEMSFEALVAVLADSCKQWVDLPERPRNDILRIAGLARMVGCRRLVGINPEKWKDEDHAEHVAIVCCLLPLMERQTRWRMLATKAMRSSAPGEPLKRLAEEIVTEADALYDRFLRVVPMNGAVETADDSGQRVPFRTARALMELEREFADAWDALDDSTPFLEDEADE